MDPLPVELQEMIFSDLSLQDLLQLARTNRYIAACVFAELDRRHARYSKERAILTRLSAVPDMKHYDKHRESITLQPITFTIPNVPSDEAPHMRFYRKPIFLSEWDRHIGTMKCLNRIGTVLLGRPEVIHKFILCGDIPSGSSYIDADRCRDCGRGLFLFPVIFTIF